MVLSLFLGLGPLIALRGEAKAGPPLPAFTSAEFQTTVRKVETALAAGDFASAQRCAEQLPKRAFGLSLDLSGVPASERPAFRDACARAMQNWGATTGMDAAHPDIRISFRPALPPDPRLGGPANLTLAFSPEPGTPRLSVALGLRRDSPERTATDTDVFNDVRYAIGAYLGLASHEFDRYVMDPVAHSDRARAMWPVERTAAGGALNLADRLRRAVATRTSIGVSASPRAMIGPAKYSGEALQGDQVQVPIQLENQGDGTLVVDAVGDCSCVIPQSAPDLGPGARGALHVRVDTRNITGPVDRSVIVLTNDPGHLMFTGAIHLDVSPRYRILVPGGTTWVVGDKGCQGDAYLALAKGLRSKLIDARIIGTFPGQVTFEPWDGVLPDPELNEGDRPRHGYRLHVKFPPGVPPGRYPVAISAYTDDPEAPSVTQTINLQHGIVALPEELLLDVGTDPRKMSVLLSRPGKPFGVRGVTSDLKSVSATAHDGDRPGEIKLDVTYDGHAPKGELSGVITVRTDDPQQPTIRVRLVGSVR